MHQIFVVEKSWICLLNTIIDWTVFEILEILNDLFIFIIAFLWFYCDILPLLIIIYYWVLINFLSLNSFDCFNNSTYWIVSRVSINLTWTFFKIEPISIWCVDRRGLDSSTYIVSCFQNEYRMTCFRDLQCSSNSWNACSNDNSMYIWSHYNSLFIIIGKIVIFNKTT